MKYFMREFKRQVEPDNGNERNFHCNFYDIIFMECAALFIEPTQQEIKLGTLINAMNIIL